MNNEAHTIMKEAINTQTAIRTVEQLAQHIEQLKETATTRQDTITKAKSDNFWTVKARTRRKNGLNIIVRIFDVSDLYKDTDTVDRIAIAHELDQVMPHETRELFKNTGIIIQFIKDKKSKPTQSSKECWKREQRK